MLGECRHRFQKLDFANNFVVQAGPGARFLIAVISAAFFQGSHHLCGGSVDVAPDVCQRSINITSDVDVESAVFFGTRLDDLTRWAGITGKKSSDSVCPVIAVRCAALDWKIANDQGRDGKGCDGSATGCLLKGWGCGEGQAVGAEPR